MRALSHWIIALFASPAGVVVLAALDSTLFFSLPFGIDAAVIILAARLHELWWIVPLLATAGSVAGAALTFWMGVKIGEQGLERWVPRQAAGAHPRPDARQRRDRARRARSDSAAVSVHAVRPRRRRARSQARTFFVTLIVCRLLRFGLESRARARLRPPHSRMARLRSVSRHRACSSSRSRSR